MVMAGVGGCGGGATTAVGKPVGPTAAALLVATPVELATLEAARATSVPRLIELARAGEPATQIGAVRALGWLALTLVVLIALATAAAVVRAARGTLDTHRGTIDVMHGIGATDDQVARLFQRKIALDALSGGTAGAVAAGIVLLLIAGGGSSWLADLTGGPLLGPRDVLLLALLPLIGTILATVVARLAVLKALRASL